nr:ribokinase [uncultured Celeribacter sp.]
MAIYNFGSVNIDHFYALPHLPAPGETLSTTEHSVGLGGKGTNQSVAVAKAGAKVFHIGAIGHEEPWVQERIAGYGVDCRFLSRVEGGTGHAVIYVDASGENSIVIDPAANARQDKAVLAKALGQAGSDDILMLQNETTLQREAAELARAKGMRVIYSAAPFSIEAVQAVIGSVSLLVMNEVESAQLCAAMELELADIPVPELLVTLGSRGAMWRSNTSGEVIEVPAPKVQPVDTTAAGDTYIGYVAAGLDLGMPMRAAMEWAARAAALKVTRAGTADAIPTANEVKSFSTA